MRFTLQVDMDGSAFDTSTGWSRQRHIAGDEISRLLRMVDEMVSPCSREDFSDTDKCKGFDIALRDSNGNTVGFARVEE